MDKIFTRVLLSDAIKLHPKLINKNFQSIILNKLKDKLEGKCSRHGYIKIDSIDVYKITPGKIELVGLNGFAIYTVHFHAEVCNPLLGSLIKCKVVNINKFGILADAGFFSNSNFINVLEVIIAKNSVNIVSDIDLDNIQINDEIIVEVMGKKYELNDNKISVVGRVVKDVSEVKKGKTKKEVADIIRDDDEEVDVTEVEINDANDAIDEVNDEEEEEEEDEEEDEEEEEEDDEKSSKGGAFFSDNSDEEYEIYSDPGSMSGSGSESADDD